MMVLWSAPVLGLVVKTEPRCWTSASQPAHVTNAAAQEKML